MNENNSLDIIRKRIKKRRSELGLSYQDLAMRTGLSKSTLQRYETGNIGNIPLDKLGVLARSLEITPEELIGWESDGEEENGERFLEIYKFFKNVNGLEKDFIVKFSKILSKLDVEDWELLANIAQKMVQARESTPENKDPTGKE